MSHFLIAGSGSRMADFRRVRFGPWRPEKLPLQFSDRASDAYIADNRLAA
jgi:hypothetical protein